MSNVKFIYFESLAGYTWQIPDYRGYNVYLPPDTTNAAIGFTLKACLKRSRFLQPDEDDRLFDPDRLTVAERARARDIAAHSCCRSAQAAFRDMLYCEVVMIAGETKIKPYIANKWRDTMDAPDNLHISVPQNMGAEQIGAALRLALSRCR